MRSVAPMRVAKIGYIAVSAALCFFGVLLIVKPEISLAAFGLFTGIVLIIFGIIKIVGYLSRDLYRLAFQYDLACGILVIALGIMVILEPNDVIETICIAVGITFLMDGLLKIQISIDAKTFGIRQWWLILSVALLTVVIGVLLVFRTSGSVRALMVLLGISLLADGIMNLTTVLSTVKIIHHQYPDRTIEEEEIFLE
ncbi:MAG: HdeD family acid-resistance protein [Candidatus Onthomonas sp.]